MLPKIRIISKNASSKSYWALNFALKSQWAHISIFSRSAARGSKDYHHWIIRMYCISMQGLWSVSYSVVLWCCHVKARPHLYANANKACGTEVNVNECQKVACSVFATQANKQAFRWLFVCCPNECTLTSVWLRTYFSLKYRLQTDSVCLFAKLTLHKLMKANAVHLHIHIMRFTFLLCSRADVDVALGYFAFSRVGYDTV